jgi:uncharacterized membrane protein YkvA (DUF1232 family)
MRVPSLLGDLRVPLRVKVAALVVALLILSPLNVFGDIPMLGVADDVALLGLLVNWFVRSADRYVVSPIDGEIVPQSSGGGQPA